MYSIDSAQETPTIIFQTVWHFASESGLKFGSSIAMKLAYQTQTKQFNDQSHLMFVEHGFVVNKIHTSIKNKKCIKNRFESVKWHAINAQFLSQHLKQKINFASLIKLQADLIIFPRGGSQNNMENSIL